MGCANEMDDCVKRRHVDGSQGLFVHLDASLRQNALPCFALFVKCEGRREEDFAFSCGAIKRAIG